MEPDVIHMRGADYVNVKKVTAALLLIRTSILSCLENERTDRQLALEDAEEALADLCDKIKAGRL
jgi:hypothetical protein